MPENQPPVPPAPDDQNPPELYQVIGAVLRDVSQARYMSDLYSRQISYAYEQDSLLRRFPVPRAEITEVVFDLKFAVRSVKVDPRRHNSRNASIGRLFDAYSVIIMREGVNYVRQKLDKALVLEPNDARSEALARFEKKFLSEDHRERLRGRLLVYLNENAADLIQEDGSLKLDDVVKVMDSVADQIRSEPDAEAVKKAFGASASGAAGFDWNRVFDDEDRKALPAGASVNWDSLFVIAGQLMRKQLDALAVAVKESRDRYPDYKVEIEVVPSKLSDFPETISTIKVTSAVKNYRWSKVDVDTKDLRNIRTLNPE